LKRQLEEIVEKKKARVMASQAKTGPEQAKIANHESEKAVGTVTDSSAQTAND
jgi:hypothetical protein